MGPPVAKLIEDGVRAYVGGRIDEALGYFTRVLELDPKNDKARTYIDLVRSTYPEAVAAPPPADPADSPPARVPEAGPPPPAVAAAPPAPVVASRPEPEREPRGTIAFPPPPEPAPRTTLSYSPGPEPVPRPPVSYPSPPVPESERRFELPASPVRLPVPPPRVEAAPVEAAPEPPAPPARPRPDLATLLEPYLSEGTSPPEPPAARSSSPPAPEAPAEVPEAGQTEAVDPDYAPSPWDDGPASGATIILPDETSGGLDLAAVAEQSDVRPLVPQGATLPTKHRGGPPNDVDLWLKAAKELFALGDFTGSLELIEKILTVDPDHGEARDYLRQNEATLVSMYESKLGPLQAVPRLAIKPEEVLWLNLDHRAGFLLAQIDGSVDYEGLFAVSGLPRLDTARILANLIADGVVKS